MIGYGVGKWLKRSESPFAVRIKDSLISLRAGDFRFLSPLGAIFFEEMQLRLALWRWFKRVVYYNPMLRYRCKSVGRRPFIESSFPLIMGHGTIIMGDNVSISGKVTFVVSYDACENPTLTIGNDVAFGHQVLIAVGQKITIEDHVGVGPGVQIYDNPSHPANIDYTIRRKVRLRAEDCDPVVLEEGCWLTTRCVVMKGVRIGKGSVVTPHSVVTSDIPAGVLAGGIPARVIKPLDLERPRSGIS